MAHQTARATFDGGEDSIAVTWTTMPGAYKIYSGLTVTDGAGPFAYYLTAVSSSGASVHAQLGVVGYVDLLILDLTSL